MRLTIKQSNREYIANLAKQWGMSEKETVNHLITQSRLGFELPINYAQPRQDTTFEYQTVAVSEFQEPQTDPTIERLLNAGLDLDF